jgi:hypothetical protein
LVTGLYAPQTAMYLDAASSSSSPALNPAFPTWGQAAAKLNPAYREHIWWFGKWHLSHEMKTPPLLPYGFRTRTYPGPDTPSPDGVNNEGTDGGPFRALVRHGSLVNPHDICGAPAWFQSSPFPPTDVSPQPVYFPPPAGSPPPFYASAPSPWTPWNYENLHHVPNKPNAQLSWANYCTDDAGPVLGALPEPVLLAAEFRG